MKKEILNCCQKIKKRFFKHRFWTLVISGILGIIFFFLFLWAYDYLSCYFIALENISNLRIRANLSIVFLALFVSLVLWFFRTHDTKEQLDKTQTNIEQQDFHDALSMLADDKLISQEIAVQRLIKISESNPEYDETIKLAFIKRMKATYKEADEALAKAEVSKYESVEAKEKLKQEKSYTTIEAAEKAKIETAEVIIKALKKVERRTYAQHIFRWFIEKYKNKELDLKNLDLRNQDFIVMDRKKKTYITDFKDKEGNAFELDCVNLAGANLTNADLSGANLKEENLIGVNLTNANLSGTILTRAKLTNAYLSKAILTKANLSGADLSEADLTGADLTNAYLNGADLSEADLTGADLTNAYLNGADLREAYLREANLTNAYLSEAYLNGADLTNAYLSEANLTNAYLRGANLSRADLEEANLSYVSLQIAKNLTYKQLTWVKSLYETEGLETVLKPEELNRLKKEKPELFEPLEK